MRYYWLILIMLALHGHSVAGGLTMEPLPRDGRAWMIWTEKGEIYSYFVDGDTVIGSHECKKIMQQRIVPSQPRPSYHSALRQEDGKVWICPRGNSTPTLLYDFTAEVGDEVVVAEGWQTEEYGTVGRKVYSVSHIDTVSVGGCLYRRLHVSGIDGVLDDVFDDVWVEGIGGRNLFCQGWYDTNYVLACLDGGCEVFSRDDFTRTAEERPYSRMLAVGKRWNQRSGGTDSGHSFYYEIRGDTLIGGVKHFRLFGHDMDGTGEDRELGLLLEADRRVHSLWTGLKNNSNTLLYDFRLNVGECPPFFFMNTVCAMACEDMRNGDSVLKRMGMGYRMNNISEWNPANGVLDWWVEGIGSSTDFIRPYRWDPLGSIRMECCTLGGDTLFTHRDFGIPEREVPTMQAAPYRPMLAEGKRWDYTFTQGSADPETGRMSQTKYDVTYTLRGDTLIGGRSYMKMYEEHEGICTYLCAWREDGRKVYAAYPGRPDSLCYDFGLPYLGRAPYDPYGAPAYLAATDVIQAGGMYHTRYWLINDQFEEIGCWVDGLGSDNGIVHPRTYTNYYLPYWHLNSCTMPDGTVLNETDLWGEATEYSSVLTQTSAKAKGNSGKGIYDLQGRRLSGIPQKGIYIQNGRKYVR